MLLHDLIKIKYSQEGWLPNYPPHLISDEEMIDAFLFNDMNFFSWNYPLYCTKEEEDLEENKVVAESYYDLKGAIQWHLLRYLDRGKEIPNWVYSYMLGSVINSNSDVRDIDKFKLGLGLKDDGTLDLETEKACLKFSLKNSSKLGNKQTDKEIAEGFINLRPPTMFGEPSIVKLMRLNEAS